VQGYGDRLMPRVQYRNFGTHETLVLNHTVDANAHPVSGWAGIRFHELRRLLPGGSFAVYQQGTFSPDSHDRWNGSAAMDRHGNLAVGYNVSSTSVFPSIRYAGRVASDPPGELSGEATIMVGGGAQTHPSGRWSSHSALSIDPVDDCTFWHTNQYYDATSLAGWRTRIASFRFPACGDLIFGDGFEPGDADRRTSSLVLQLLDRDVAELDQRGRRVPDPVLLGAVVLQGDAAARG